MPSGTIPTTCTRHGYSRARRDHGRLAISKAFRGIDSKRRHIPAVPDWVRALTQWDKALALSMELQESCHRGTGWAEWRDDGEGFVA